MIRLVLLELTEGIVRYKYYPENSKEYGIVAYDRRSGERIFEKIEEKYGRWYGGHAFRYLEECNKTGHFDETTTIAWY